MRKGNLLIVDDDEMVLKLLEATLADTADTVYVAQDGKQAINLLEESGPEINCIVCDINMPEVNGIDVIKAYRKMDIKIPFIFYTGHGDGPLMLKALRYGAYDFLCKPNLDGLEEVVTNGLKEGLSTTFVQGPSQAEGYISEYRAMLDSPVLEDLGKGSF